MIKTGIWGALCLLALPLAAQAGENDSGFMPANGIFIGAGGAWNGANFPDQNIYGFGVSQNYAIGRILVATGAAAGNAYPNLGTDSSISPVIQAGFYRTFEGTPWIWGAKFSYNQVGVTGVARDVLIPQSGGYTGLIQGTFTGNYLLSSYEVSLDHQFALVPILGYSFGRGFVYGGAGATLSHITNNMNGLVGFAELDHRYAVSGAPASFSDSNWVWGATATAGVTYFFARGWFIDMSYSYTASATPTNSFANQFDTSYPQVEFVGVSGGYRSGTVNNQALTVTVNYAF